MGRGNYVRSTPVVFVTSPVLLGKLTQMMFPTSCTQSLYSFDCKPLGRVADTNCEAIYRGQMPNWQCKWRESQPPQTNFLGCAVLHARTRSKASPPRVEIEARYVAAARVVQPSSNWTVRFGSIHSQCAPGSGFQVQVTFANVA